MEILMMNRHPSFGLFFPGEDWGRPCIYHYTLIWKEIFSGFHRLGHTLAPCLCSCLPQTRSNRSGRQCCQSQLLGDLHNKGLGHVFVFVSIFTFLFLCLFLRVTLTAVKPGRRGKLACCHLHCAINIIILAINYEDDHHELLKIVTSRHSREFLWLE